jgi:hypothetical protein
MRGWGDTNRDGVVTAKESVAYAGIVLRTLPNNHEQHPSLSGPDEDVELSKNAKEPSPDLFELRKKVLVWRPPAPPRGPELRVKARCMSPETLTPDEGLYVSIDHVAVHASALDSGADGKSRWISFPVPAGQHTIRVGSPMCKASETLGYFQAGQPTVVDATLESNEGLLERAPFGKPNGWSLRFSAGYERRLGPPMSSVGFSQRPGVTAGARTKAIEWGLSSLELAIGSRFISAGLGFDFGVGPATTDVTISRAEDFCSVSAFGDKVCGPTENRVERGPAFIFGPKVFIGPKVPLGRVSWNLVEALAALRFLSVWSGTSEVSAPTAVQFSWGIRSGLDVAVRCDVSLGGRGGYTFDGFGGNGTSILGQLSLTYQPSTECRREREAGIPHLQVTPNLW